MSEPKCRFCHQHTVNGPRTARYLYTSALREQTPICGICARSRRNNPYCSITPAPDAGEGSR